MYTRSKIWQEATIASQSESGWINTITLTFSCIDFRMKLYGYGWKENASDENVIVTYPGRYDCYFREAGDEVWELFASVISERAGYDDSTVYEDTFVELGLRLTQERIYEIKIVAADGEKFTNWGGSLEGISSGDQLWHTLKVRSDRTGIIYSYESVSITEYNNLHLDELNINEYEEISISEFHFPQAYIIILLSVYETITIVESDSQFLIWAINVNETITIVENNSTVFANLSILSFEEVTILEAPMGYAPTINILPYPQSPPLDHIIIEEDINLYLIINVDVNDTVTITESTTPHDIIIELGIVADNISMTENITAKIIILLSAYEEISIVDIVVPVVAKIPIVSETISLTENIDIYLNVLSINIFDSILITEDIDIYLNVLNINIFDSISIIENVNMHDIVIELGIVYEEVSIVEDISLATSPLVSVYDSITIIESVTMHDIVIELGLVYEEVSIVENIKNIVFNYNVEVYDYIFHAKLNDNETNSTVLDASINSNNGNYKDVGGNINTDTGSIAGMINTAIELDGDEYIDFGDLDICEGLTSVSFTYWVKVTSNAYQSVISKMHSGDSQYSFNSQVGGGVSYPVASVAFFTDGLNGGNWSTDDDCIPLNTWTHIAIVADLTGQTCVIYVNGQSVANSLNEDGTGLPATILASTANVLIGAVTGGTHSLLTGAVDDVRIFDRLLSADEAYFLANTHVDERVDHDINLNDTSSITEDISLGVV